jgi:hypothetical protein
MRKERSEREVVGEGAVTADGDLMSDCTAEEDGGLGEE